MEGDVERGPGEFGLSETPLKVVACAAMLCDHAAVALLPAGTATYDLLRIVGRVAFPVFCLGVAEGARHTHDWRRYLLRLVLLAAVSELPHDLVLSRGLGRWDPLYLQDVVWELAAGLVAVRACMAVGERVRRRGSSASGAGAAVGMCAVTAGVGFAAELLRLDYGWQGVALIVLLWALRDHPVARALAPAAALAHELPWVLGGSLLVACYDGSRGRVSRAGARAFYWFYPAHLAVLALVAWLVG